MTPIRIKTKQHTRPALGLSPKNAIPMIAVPAVPMPTKAAYTVAAGSSLTDSAKRNIIGIDKTTPIRGDHLETATEHFNIKGHVTSKTSARRIHNHAI